MCIVRDLRGRGRWTQKKLKNIFQTLAWKGTGLRLIFVENAKKVKNQLTLVGIALSSVAEPQSNAAPALNLFLNTGGLTKMAQTITASYFSHLTLYQFLNQQNSGQKNYLNLMSTFA
jgi:hypothetical protein